MRPLAILFLILAFALIALGRYHVRYARRREPPRRSPLGWLLTLAGFLAMLAGVILW